MAARSTNGYSSNGINNYMPLAGILLSLFISLGSAFWTVANPRDDIKSIKADSEYRLENLRREVQANYMTIAEYREYRDRKDKDTERLDRSIQTIQSDLVSRSEHKQHWDEQNDKVNALRDQLIQLQKDFGGSWNIGKQLDLIQREIDEMRTAGGLPPARRTATPTGGTQ